MHREKFGPPRESGVAFAVKPVHHEDARYHIRGDVFFYLRPNGDSAPPDASGDTPWYYKVKPDYELRNLVVLDASILIARLMKDNQEPPFGIYALAIGTGDVGWNPMAPPAPTTTQRSLYSELARKTFASTTFIDGGGVPTAIPTNVVDFTTTFAEAEAVGPLVEMGLLGGNISTNMAVKNPVLPPNGPYNPAVDLTLYETEINYLTFPVINKPPTSTFTIVWRLTF